MKKLGKLKINPERIMKNEELLVLHGGTYPGNTCFYCECQPSGSPYWYSWASSQQAAEEYGSHWCSPPDTAVCWGGIDPDNCYQGGGGIRTF